MYIKNFDIFLLYQIYELLRELRKRVNINRLIINIVEFEGDKLLAHPSSFYIAGFEATATTLAFLLYDLARHPEHQDALYNEIQTHLSGKQLTADLINKLSFLDSVTMESLRLHPPLPVTDRITIRDYKVSNILKVTNSSTCFLGFLVIIMCVYIYV